MKKILSIVISLSLLCSVLMCGCAKKAEVIFTLDGYSVTNSEYMYWMSYYKTSFINVFSEAGYIDPDEYNEEFWNTSSPDGVSLKQMTSERVDDSVKKVLVCQMLFDEYGLDTEEALTAIDSAVDEKIAEDIASFGSRSSLNKELAQYGLNINSLSELYASEFRRTILLDYLYGDEGTEKVTDAERDEYYEANYSRVKHVLIDLNEKYVLEDGEKVMDPSTGYYKTEKLTDEEKEERKKLAQTVLEKAESGEEFEKLITEYGEDEGMEYYTDGYFIKEGDSYEENFIEAALGMKDGEVRLVESTYGLHIMKKYPLEEDGYTKEVNANFFSGLDDLVQEQKENEKLESYFSRITTDETLHSAVDFATVPLMSDKLTASSEQ